MSSKARIKTPQPRVKIYPVYPITGLTANYPGDWDATELTELCASASAKAIPGIGVPEAVWWATGLDYMQKL